MAQPAETARANEDRVRRARLARGLSQLELARRAGISRQALSAVEAGLYQPGVFFTPPLLGNHIDYDFLGDYRLRDQVSLGISWNGQIASSRNAVYAGRLELRSYF